MNTERQSRAGRGFLLTTQRCIVASILDFALALAFNSKIAHLSKGLFRFAVSAK